MLTNGAEHLHTKQASQGLSKPAKRQPLWPILCPSPKSTYYVKVLERRDGCFYSPLIEPSFLLGTTSGASNPRISGKKWMLFMSFLSWKGPPRASENLLPNRNDAVWGPWECLSWEDIRG